MYLMHGNEEHNPKAIDYRRSQKIGARSSQSRGKKKIKRSRLRNVLFSLLSNAFPGRCFPSGWRSNARQGYALVCSLVVPECVKYAWMMRGGNKIKSVCLLRHSVEYNMNSPTHLNIVYASLCAGSLMLGSFSRSWTPITIYVWHLH